MGVPRGIEEEEAALAGQWAGLDVRDSHHAAEASQDLVEDVLVRRHFFALVFSVNLGFGVLGSV